MQIQLLRHGIAEEFNAQSGDDGRSLTPEGTERLRRATKGWRQLGDVPQAIWSSPLLRAQQTAAVFAEGMRFQGEVQTVAALRPEADLQVIVQQLEAAQLGGLASVVLVGHEPHLGSLLGLLLHGRQGLSIPMRKGMLATVVTHASTSLHSRLRCCIGQRIAGRLG